MQTYTHRRHGPVMVILLFFYTDCVQNSTGCRCNRQKQNIPPPTHPKKSKKKKVVPSSNNHTISVIVTEKFFGTLRFFVLCVFTNSSFCNEQFETNMVLLLVAKQWKQTRASVLSQEVVQPQNLSVCLVCKHHYMYKMKLSYSHETHWFDPSHLELSHAFLSTGRKLNTG